MALQDLLNITQKHDKIGISEERIEAIKPIIRQYIAFWREYPDMFVDFLPCYVYRDADRHGDCTNGGTSSRHSRLYLCKDYVTPEDVR